MKQLRTNLLAAGMVCAAMAWALCFAPGTAAAATEEEQAVQQQDRALLAALVKSDKPAVEKVLDADFMWTDTRGDTIGRMKALASLPKPTLGDESGATVNVRAYGPQVVAVRSSIGKVHVLRIWVKRPAGWRILDFHEVAQRSGPAPPPGPSTNDCENPCKGVPYTPKNAAEKGILTSWGQLETAVTNHDPKAWEPHFLDEFALIASGGDEPVTKAGRIAQLSKPGIGPAPPQLAAKPEVKFFHFGDTVVMIAQANPYAGKPAHISRIWVNRDGLWRMAFSYQTTIQSAPAIMPPKGKS